MLPPLRRSRTDRFGTAARTFLVLFIRRRTTNSNGAPDFPAASFCSRPNAFVNQLRKELAVNEKASPLGVVSSSGLRSHYFIEGCALFFESSDPVANNGEHVAIRGHFGFGADRAVPGITMVL